MTSQVYFTQISQYGLDLINQHVLSGDPFIADDWYMALGTGALTPSIGTTHLTNKIFDKTSSGYLGITVGTDGNVGRYAEIQIPFSMQGNIITEMALFDSGDNLILSANTLIDLTQSFEKGLYKTVKARMSLEAIPSNISVTTVNPPSNFLTVEQIDQKYVRQDGSTPFLAPQKGVDPIAEDDLATMAYAKSLIPNLMTINSINNGPVDSSGNPDVLHFNALPYMNQDWVNPKMTSRSQNGYTVTGDYGHSSGSDQSYQFWNEDLESANNFGSFTKLSLPSGQTAIGLQLTVQGTNGVGDRGFYCARYAVLTFYRNGVQVHTTGQIGLPWPYDKSVKYVYDIPAPEFDAIQASVGGNPNCPQQETGGFKITGYQVVTNPNGGSGDHTTIYFNALASKPIVLTDYLRNKATISNISNLVIPGIDTSAGTALSGGDTASYPASNAFDSSASSAWQSSQQYTSISGAAYIGKNFGASKQIKNIVLNQTLNNDKLHYITSVKVQTSTNGTSWTDVQTFDSLVEGVNILYLSSALNTQYVRLLANANLATSGYSWAIVDLSFNTAPCNLYLGTNGSVDCFQAPFTSGKVFPSNPVANHVHYLTAAEPNVQYRYVNNAWAPYAPVQFGQVLQNSSGIIANVIQPKFNQNKYDINFNSFIQSLAQNSINCSLPNGLTLKAGILTNIPGGSFTVTFPLAFNTACVYANYIAGANNASGNSNPIVSAISSAGFTGQNSVGVTTTYYWFAIGY